MDENRKKFITRMRNIGHDGKFPPAMEELAWKLYCDDTKGSMDCRDFWEELSPKVQQLYLKKAEDHERQNLQTQTDLQKP